MGCSSSKRTNAVHPTTDATESSIVHVQEYPDPPSTTPEPDGDLLRPSVSTRSSSSSASLPLPAKLTSHQLASELQHKLQQKKSSKPPQYFRQMSEGSDYTVALDSSSSFITGSTSPSTLSDSLDQSDNGSQSLSPNPCGRQPFFSNPFNTAGLASPYPRRIYETDSQIEFFKMLDKKIEGGPDYDPSQH